jgi:hypothetical protein
VADMTRRFGWLVAVLALVLALGGTARVAAQDESEIPEGATDGATIAFSPASIEDAQAPIYSFGVFTFEDDDAAEAGLDDYVQQFQDNFAADEETSAEITELDGDDVDGLDDLGDEAHAYIVDTSADEELAGTSVGLLAVRDGAQFQVWLGVVLDFSAFTGDATAEPVDARAGIDALLEIAPDWFGGDRPDDGDLVEQLPGLDQLPDGYEETARAEGLEEIEAQ